MKFDLKTSIIVILSGLVLFLGGYILGDRSSKPSQKFENPEIAKQYKDLVGKDIREFADDISVCYREFLAKVPAIQEGKLDLVIKVKDNGIVEEMEVSKNELGSLELKNCVLKKLSSLRLKPLPAGLNPYISHTLAFKSDETLQKEAEQRKNRMPKVLPRE